MAVSLHRTVFAFSGLVAVTFVVWQPAMGQPPGGREGGRGMFRMPLMTAIDADGDGEISASEINDAPAHLRGLDANKDGRLTPDELRPAGGPAGGAGGAAGGEEMVNRLMEYDTDKDGRLKAEDLPERMRNIIARADANKDGSVDRAELLAMNRSEGGQRGEGRREGDRGGLRGGDPAAFVDRLFEYDADKDGKLSREELAAMRGPGGREPGGREGGERREGAGGGRRPPVEE
jgi:Ca2+-binding EF-hand superfamily protein